MASMQTAGPKNWELEELLLHARQNEPSHDESAMPLVRHLHDTWRRMTEQEERPAQDALSIERLRFDLAHALFADTRKSAAFDHAQDPAVLAEVYHALESRFLTEDYGSNQAGFGNVLSALRHAAMDSEAGPNGIMPREIEFKASGIGYRTIDLVARFPEAGPNAHRGEVALAIAGEPHRPLARLAVADVTGYRGFAHSIEALGILHRFSRYGVGLSTFGSDFSADGHGRGLLAAMIGGLVNRVLPDLRNSHGGLSPQFALTDRGVEFVLNHPKVLLIFEHYNNHDKNTAYLNDRGRRVPFDVTTGAILGRLETGSTSAPGYVIRSSLGRVEPGKDYARDELGYLLSLDIEENRRRQVQLEDGNAATPAPVQLSEEESDDEYGVDSEHHMRP